MTRMILPLALVAVLTAQSLSGQESAADQEVKGRQVWILATSLPPDVQNPVTIRSGDQLTERKLSKRAIGLPVKVPKNGMIHVGRPATDEEGNPTFESWVSAQIPEGINQSLLVLVPVPKLPGTRKFRSRIVDLDKFKGGECLFLNLTTLTIGVALGDQRETIAPGKIKTLSVGHFEGTKVTKISYHYRTAADQPWQMISASTVPLVSSRREILIFSYDEDLGQIDYHGISFDIPKE